MLAAGHDATVQRAKRKREDAVGLAPASASVKHVPSNREGRQSARYAEPEGPSIAAVAGLASAQQPIPEGSPRTCKAALLGTPELPEAVLTPEGRAECVQLLRQAGTEGATVVERGGARRLVGPLRVNQQPQTGEG